MGNEIWRMGAVDLAAAIRSKKLKSREVVEAHLARIASVNPRVNAVTATLDEAALEAADSADARVAAGQAMGPLHGVPISVKENIDLLGSPTTQGVVPLADAMPSLDAPQVTHIKNAGAIPFARTNLPDFGMRWHSDNALRGATVNPWDRSRTAGGSSGGEAAALATGMTPLGLGNDYGGSLRWPSQCNGTTAIRPTLGRIASAGSFEPQDSPMTLQLFAVQGPMARHVRDLRVALEIMSAPNSRDPWYTPAPLRGPDVPRRVAVCADPGGLGVHPDIAAGVARAADALRDAGYQVDDVELPVIELARDTWDDLVMCELRMGLAPLLEQLACADALTFLKHAFARRPALDHAGYMQGFAARSAVARAWSEFHSRYPLVLGPVATIQPFPVGHDLAGPAEVGEILNGLRLVVLGNLLGLPAAVVPVGVANGLPQGVQLIGDRYREDLCLDAADAIEVRLGLVTPIDPV